MTCTSSISGRLRRVTGSPVSRVAARQGKAAFLLPLARRLPRRGWPPSIRYLNIGLRLNSKACFQGCQCSTGRKANCLSAKGLRSMYRRAFGR